MTNAVTITAPEGVPYIDIEREFDAPVSGKSSNSKGLNGEAFSRTGIRRGRNTPSTASSKRLQCDGPRGSPPQSRPPNAVLAVVAWSVRPARLL